MIQDRRTKGSHATTTIHGHNQLTGPGTYVYDGNGNPTTFGGTALTWDVENRMTAHGSALEAAYRGDGLRAWKEGATRTYFLYDGINLVCELDAVGDLLAASTFGAAGLLSRGAVQYQFDPLGDAVHLLDATGDVTATRLFDAWGNELTSGDFNPRGYRAKYGYYTDEETGLIALAYRYYGPGVGRFRSRDPLLGGTVSSSYWYVRSRPTLRLDRSGREEDSERLPTIREIGGYLKPECTPSDPLKPCSRDDKGHPALNPGMPGPLYFGDADRPQQPAPILPPPLFQAAPGVGYTPIYDIPPDEPRDPSPAPGWQGWAGISGSVFIGIAYLCLSLL
ncbi:MAG: hypothetical protein IT204_09970 [Fimbriimonadaceae bacterium]|nr:hypothetical protein [Fimbriimonadaceae bacterium]